MSKLVHITIRIFLPLLLLLLFLFPCLLDMLGAIPPTTQPTLQRVCLDPYVQSSMIRVFIVLRDLKAKSTVQALLLAYGVYMAVPIHAIFPVPSTAFWFPDT